MPRPLSSGPSLLKTGATLLSAVALSSLLFTSPAQAETTYRLSLSIIGSGQVNGDLSCLSGTTCPQQEIAAGNTINLVATPTIDTLFDVWLGCTTNLGNSCTVFMDAAKDLYVLFKTAPIAKNQQTGQEYFSVLQAAYDNAADGETIMMRMNSAQLTGGLVADKNVGISLKGGYTSDYSGTQTGYTTLQGPVTIRSGTVIVDRLIVVPVDATPDVFTFVDQTGVALSTLIESAPITVSGINTAAAITVSGGEYAISADGGSSYGAYTDAAGTVTNGNMVKVRHTSSASISTNTNTSLTIG